MEKAPLVSIIIVNFNGREVTKKLLDSLKKLDFKEKYEIILVDNDSKDGSQELVRKKYPHVKLIENKYNAGWTEGVNIGFRAAKGKYYAPLNNDIIADRNWLKELVKAIEKHPDAGAVGPIVLNKYSEKEYMPFEGYGTTTLIQFASDTPWVPKDTKKELNTWTISGVYLGKTAVAKEFPGNVPYDKDYFAYAEDNYVCWMMRIKGYQLYTVPSSILYHEGEFTVKKFKGMSTFFTFLAERNRLLNMLTFYSFGNLIRLIPYFLILVLFINLYDFKKIPIRMKIYWYILSNAGTIIRKRTAIQKQRRANDRELVKQMSCNLFDAKHFGSPVMRTITEVINKMLYCYCLVTGIRTIEFRKK